MDYDDTITLSYNYNVKSTLTHRSWIVDVMTFPFENPLRFSVDAPDYIAAEGVVRRWLQRKYDGIPGIMYSIRMVREVVTTTVLEYVKVNEREHYYASRKRITVKVPQEYEGRLNDA